jgi:hypothetical protein
MLQWGGGSISWRTLRFLWICSPARCFEHCFPRWWRDGVKNVNTSEARKLVSATGTADMLRHLYPRAVPRIFVEQQLLFLAWSHMKFIRKRNFFCSLHTVWYTRKTKENFEDTRERFLCTAFHEVRNGLIPSSECD